MDFLNLKILKVLGCKTYTMNENLYFVLRFEYGRKNEK